VIPYGKQDITQSDIDAVVDVLKSDYLTQGPQVPKFEDRIKGYCGAKYAVASNSATSSLHLACLSLGLSKGEWIWTTPITFVSTANCGRFCGANVDFVDIDPDTFNLSPLALEKKLIEAKKSGCLPKIVIPVHLGGQSCDMSAIHALSQKYGFKIIEDASHSIGGKYKKLPIGNCQYSDITVFSFHPVKIITTGEGGVATTKDEQLFKKMKLLRSHGITRDTDMMTQDPDGPWYYQQIELGYNYRMTDIQAALGISQLGRLDEYVRKRHEISRKYFEELINLPIRTQFQHPDAYSSYHLYIIRLNTDQTSISQKELANKLLKNGIGVNLHYIPLHIQPYYKKHGFKLGDYPFSEHYYKESLSIPIFPGMKPQEQEKIIKNIKSILE